jgi:RNA polymerase-binding transcription factor DksA
MLKSADVRRLQERLIAQGRELQSRIEANKQGVRETIQDDIGVGDQADESDLLYEREFELDENVDDRVELAQIRKALDRIEQGTYGLSEVSGKPIPLERLEALPSATTLVDERLPEP